MPPPRAWRRYLAEDRILVFELLAKANCRWTVKYVKEATARTDVPTSLVALLAQRRRWINGPVDAGRPLRSRLPSRMSTTCCV